MTIQNMQWHYASCAPKVTTPLEYLRPAERKSLAADIHYVFLANLSPALDWHVHPDPSRDPQCVADAPHLNARDAAVSIAANCG
jgi:hypothetical protein